MSIDNLTIGQNVTLNYAKEADKLPSEYKGVVEGVKGTTLTLKTDNGYRSFTAAKIARLCVE